MTTRTHTETRGTRRGNLWAAALCALCVSAWSAAGATTTVVTRAVMTDTNGAITAPTNFSATGSGLYPLTWGVLASNAAAGAVASSNLAVALQTTQAVIRADVATVSNMADAAQTSAEVAAAIAEIHVTGIKYVASSNIVASGAGSNVVDGTYIPASTYGGYPTWTNTTGASVMFYSGGTWYINSEVNGGLWYYYDNASGSGAPLSGTWLEYTGGVAPAPTMAYAPQTNTLTEAVGLYAPTGTLGTAAYQASSAFDAAGAALAATNGLAAPFMAFTPTSRWVSSASGIATGLTIRGGTVAARLRSTLDGGFFAAITNGYGFGMTNSDPTGYAFVYEQNDGAVSLQSGVGGTTRAGTRFGQTNASAARLYSAFGPLALGAYTDHEVVIGANDKPILRMDDGGLTGLVSAVFLSNLTVNGTISGSGLAYIGSSNGVGTNTTVSGWLTAGAITGSSVVVNGTLNAGTLTNGNITITGQTAHVFFTDQYGYIGYANESHSMRFDANTLNFYETTGGQWLFYNMDANTYCMMIQANGSVGISTSAPSERLHVHGSALVVSNLTVGMSITGASAVVTGDLSVGGSATGNDATLTNQFVTFKQLQDYSAGSDAFWFYGSSNAAVAGILASYATNWSYSTPSSGGAVTQALALADGTNYAAAYVSDRTFMRVAGGAGTVKMWAWRSANPDTISMKAEFYLLDTVANTNVYEFEPSPAYHTLTTTPTEYSYSLPVIDYVSTNALRLSVRLKTISASSATIYLGTEGAYLSHANLTLPSGERSVNYATTAGTATNWVGGAATWATQSLNTATGALNTAAINALIVTQALAVVTNGLQTAWIAAASNLAASAGDTNYLSTTQTVVQTMVGPLTIVPAASNVVSLIVSNSAGAITGTQRQFVIGNVGGTKFYVDASGNANAYGNLAMAGDSFGATLVDPDTYLWFVSGGDRINVRCGGLSLMDISPSAINVGNAFAGSLQDVDVRIQSQQSQYSLFVEGSSGNVGIYTSAPPRRLSIGGTNAVIAIQARSDTDPIPAALTNCAQLFATNIVSAELQCMDGAGNVTELSSHEGLTHIARSFNVYTGTGRVIDLDALADAVAQLTGKTNIIRRFTTPRRDWDAEQRGYVYEREVARTNATKALADWTALPADEKAKQEKPVVPPALQAVPKPKWLTDWEAEEAEK